MMNPVDDQKDNYLFQLKRWVGLGYIRSVDYQLAHFLSDKIVYSPENILLSALVSYELATGNVCLPLSRLQSPQDYWPDEISDLLIKIDWSRVELDELVLGSGEPVTPLVLDKERFYLYRYWQYECSVAEALILRAVSIETDEVLLQAGLRSYFPTENTEEIDWQKVAAALAVQKRFSVISGGPGTGKTTTVIKLLALYIEQQKAKGDSFTIQLAAPTGKAAARLAESISSAKHKLDLEPQLKAEIPSEASTLHRLLGVIPNSIRFRHDAENPLHLDLLVLDEASMVDLPMMSRLLRALPASARLVLLGDRDQLASVEAGSVLGDICSWPDKLYYSAQQSSQLNKLCQLAQPLPVGASSTFSDSLAMLHKSYRFDDQSGIGYLARAVNAGCCTDVKAVIKAGYSDLNYHYLSQDSYEAMINTCVDIYAELFKGLFSGGNPQQLLVNMTRFQLLCARRQGAYGVEGLNDRIYTGLRERGLIKEEGGWYPGRPIMITRNDTSLSLFNGDIGVAAFDDTGRLKVWFEESGELRSVLPSRLPEHDTVFAMTIHKSQGSEFERVMMVLPPTDSPLLSRELLYTGVTRAKKVLDIIATESVLLLATERRTERAGGLALRLWK
ncbi:exodeoxyribonuclease V subunit alpha [Neptuniibacter sp. 1_MG-2023]|uniref:exodeoxyribonuclease V subunit alpha n=1 Tax=Neptuniibacter sp. 1_MG-2023 TaxID=3062662 RepID=UPI0026E22DC8|nr:exodeoxyribonuclease V subunit alpha [Neptuniibacter sp. 1_MG-2023]MDO6593846.1 exodeoxyribonuclease V subunit alpha [Neptuniibacter sp. 1_MG-2023]